MRRTRQIRKAKRAVKVRSPKLKRRRSSKTKGHSRKQRRNSQLCDTLSELAAVIYNHFKNPDGSTQLQYDITKQVVSEWRMGRRLDGAPLPPSRVNGSQYDGKQWIEWFDHHMLSKWQIGTNRNGHINADDIRSMKQEDEREALLQRKWEREKDRGLFMTVDEHNRIAAEFGMVLNNAITEHGERQLSIVLIEKLNSLNLSEDQRQNLIGLIREGALAASDNLREAIKRQVADSQKKPEVGA